MAKSNKKKKYVMYGIKFTATKKEGQQFKNELREIFGEGQTRVKFNSFQHMT